MQPALLQTIRQYVEQDFPYLDGIFEDYSRHPELSLQEFETSKKQYDQYKKAGCDVVEFCAGTGVVALIQNGPGPVLLFRNDHDALPIHDEITGKYASTRLGIAHKCGHSLVPAVSVGIARNLVRLKEHWQGTVMLVSQLGEEGADGARLMLNDGLYTRFPQPDLALAFHCSPYHPVGHCAFRKGYAFSTTEMGQIRVKGQGGHGGVPENAIDPIVLASAIVLRVQTIVSREISPLEPAVLSICSIVSSSQHPAVIPSEVELKFTIRCFGNPVFAKICAALERICNAEAAASGLPPDMYPEITYRGTVTEAVYNDPALTTQVENIFREILGEPYIHEAPCYTFGEDFGHLGLQGAIPLSLIWLGCIAPEKFDAAGNASVFLEPLHSPKFMPEPETIKTGVLAMTGAIIEMLGRS